MSRTSFFLSWGVVAVVYLHPQAIALYHLVFP